MTTGPPTPHAAAHNTLTRLTATSALVGAAGGATGTAGMSTGTVCTGVGWLNCSRWRRAASAISGEGGAMCCLQGKAQAVRAWVARH